MLFNEVFSARALAVRIENDPSNAMAFLGEAFFNTDKKAGIDLKWIKAKNGVAVALKPSTLDAIPTIRPRKGFVTLAEEMPLFREEMKISETDESNIDRAKESGDPYLMEVLRNIYDDASNLVSGAEVSAEKMRMSLLAPLNGDSKIVIGMADNVIANYNYDPAGDWKAKNYMALNTGKWDDPATAKPLNDLDRACTRLAEVGALGTYAVMNTTTLNYLVACAQIANAMITSTGITIGYVDKQTVKDVIKAKTGLTVLVYDKTYEDYDGQTKKFYPDGYVSVVGANQLGKLWMGRTPEERSAAQIKDADIAIVKTGIAVATKTVYGPPVQHSVTASMIALPSLRAWTPFM